MGSHERSTRSVRVFRENAATPNAERTKQSTTLCVIHRWYVVARLAYRNAYCLKTEDCWVPSTWQMTVHLFLVSFISSSIEGTWWVILQLFVAFYIYHLSSTIVLSIFTQSHVLFWLRAVKAIYSTITILGYLNPSSLSSSQNFCILYSLLIYCNTRRTNMH